MLIDMKLSIFTPSHRPSGLPECWDSIRSQANGLDIEWVVLLNGGAHYTNVDPRVKIFTAPHCPSVGALKKHACSLATGDVLIELDHDDILLPGCLERIHDAAREYPFSFIYSDTLELLDGKDHAYGVHFGWKHYQFQGHTINQAFKPHPRSLCEIFYAPNHVRAWTREAYFAAGGHDPTLPVCDDHKLMIDTYLCGADFIHIPTPLYLQRVTAASTQKERNAEIQKKQAELRDANYIALWMEWARREGLACIDCGDLPAPDGFGKKIDTIKDGSCGIIRAHEFLPSVPQEKRIDCINSLHRMLAPGGLLLTSHPSTDGRGAFQLPDQRSLWNRNSWWYFTQGNLASRFPAITARFQMFRQQDGHLNDWFKEHDISHSQTDLVALHGQRIPGKIDFPEYRKPVTV